MMNICKLFEASFNTNKNWFKFLGIHRSSLSTGKNHIIQNSLKSSERNRNSTSDIPRQSKTENQTTQAEQRNETKVTGRNGEMLYEMNIPKSSADIFREKRISNRIAETQSDEKINEKINNSNFNDRNENNYRFHYTAGLLSLILASYFYYLSLRKNSSTATAAITATLENNKVNVNMKKDTESQQFIDSRETSHATDQRTTQPTTSSRNLINKPIWLTDKK